MGTELGLTPKVTYAPSGPIRHSHASIHLTFMENLPCARYCSVFTEYLRNLNKKKFLSSGHLLLVKSEKLKRCAIGWKDSTHLYDVTDIDWCSDCTIGWEDSTHLYVWCSRHGPAFWLPAIESGTLIYTRNVSIL